MWSVAKEIWPLRLSRKIFFLGPLFTKRRDPSFCEQRSQGCACFWGTLLSKETCLLRPISQKLHHSGMLHIVDVENCTSIISIRICIHTHIHTHTYLHMQTHIYHSHPSLHPSTYLNIRTYIWCIYVYICVVYIYTYVHICIYIYVYICK